ncbi:hypothetical protein ACVWXM_006314 [Bradyrhizobium sp. GM7.3]
MLYLLAGRLGVSKVSSFARPDNAGMQLMPHWGIALSGVNAITKHCSALVMCAEGTRLH